MKNLIIILSLVISIHSFAGSSTKKAMRNVLEDYVKLFSYIYGNETKDINIKINNLEKSFKNAQHDKMLNSPNFSPIADIFKETLSEVKSGYKDHNYNYSKLRLKRSISLCITCHTQLPSNQYSKIINQYPAITSKYVVSNHDKAMLSYFFRDYKSAIAFFKKEFIESSYKNISILKNIINIYITNLNKEDEAKGYLISLIDLPQSIKSLSNIWVTELNKAFPARPIKDLVNDLEKIKDVMNSDPKYTVKTARLRRAFTAHSVKNPKSKYMPEVLYSLGLLHDNNGDIYLYSLGEMYFKKCIINFPKSKIANNCYQAYKDSIYFGFTGSSGTHIPKVIKKELQDLKSKIEKESN